MNQSARRLEISGVGAKGTHDLLVVTVGHAGHDLMRTNIDTSGVGVDLCAYPRTDGLRPGTIGYDGVC